MQQKMCSEHLKFDFKSYVMAPEAPQVARNRVQETKIDKLKVLKTAIMIQLNVQFNNLSYIQPLLTSIGGEDDSGSLIDQICKNQKQKTELEALVIEKEDSADLADVDPYEQDLQFCTYLKRLVAREIRAMQQVPHLSAFSSQLEQELRQTLSLIPSNQSMNRLQLTSMISGLVGTYQKINHILQNKGMPQKPEPENSKENQPFVQATSQSDES